MNKRQMVAEAVELLKENNIRKKLAQKSETFKIIQESSGDEASFTVNRKDKEIYYSAQDVRNILDALLFLAEDKLKHGEPVTIHGFGSIEMKHMAERRVREPLEEIWHHIPACYRPRFKAGTKLLEAGRAYELLLKDQDPDSYLPPPVEDEDDGEY